MVLWLPGMELGLALHGRLLHSCVCFSKGRYHFHKIWVLWLILLLNCNFP